MAVDAFVMPLWRFKAGDFVTGVERLAGGVGNVTYFNFDATLSVRSRRVGFFARRRARRDVIGIRKAVERANNCAVEWHDEGATVYNAQLHDYTPLIDYVWWLDRRDLMPEFPHRKSDEEKRNFYGTARDRASTFPHLAVVPFHSGYVLPCDFGRPIDVEPYMIFNTWPAAWKVVSAARLRVEIARVNETLNASADYQWTEGDPVGDVKVVFNRIREIVDLSCRHGLPAIFWG